MAPLKGRTSLKDKLKNKNLEAYSFHNNSANNPETDPYLANHVVATKSQFNSTKNESIPKVRELLNQLSSENKIPKKEIIVPKQIKPDEDEERVDPDLRTGVLKFFDWKNGFGFITLNDFKPAIDIFVYRKDLKKSKVDFDALRKAKDGLALIFRFQIAHYIAKGRENRKAVNLELLAESLG